MSPAARIALFVVALAIIFAGAYAAGALDPDVRSDPAPAPETGSDERDH